MTIAKYSTPRPKRVPGHVQPDGRRANDGLIPATGDPLQAAADAITRLTSIIRATCEPTPRGYSTARKKSVIECTEEAERACMAVIFETATRSNYTEVPTTGVAPAFAGVLNVGGASGFPSDIHDLLTATIQTIHPTNFKGIIPAKTNDKLERIADELRAAHALAEANADPKNDPYYSADYYLTHHRISGGMLRQAKKAEQVAFKKHPKKGNCNLYRLKDVKARWPENFSNA